ncbi:uncharacterized protein LOC126905540 isoform X2 [Daktulosphaira vitifoliae]|uniref:uncharacterized protein LOC126905540 isoform X2 n=1 Tax=Daktulosphaira vitifoliae TaxID=58002 RepID=UPI0021AA66CB|nr:uncharacterized protein LOC126905540 isoform X2 [Daktulosphaira vitifoliae]
MTIKQKYIKELIYRSMAYFHNEDSSDGTLIIDEQNEDFETIELSDDSDTEKLDNINFNNDVEVISSSSSKCSSFDDDSSHTCSFCSKLFYDKISLYDHISTYQGSCSTNMLGINERNIEVDSELDCTYERKLEKYTLDKVPVPEAIPLSPKLSSVSCVSNTINKSIPSLRQMLVDEIEPEHPCLICGQIFRHNIGLICHINSDHKEVHNEKKNSIIETTNKSGRKKRVSKDIKVKKIVENLEPLSNKVDLTLLPDLKKDTLINRIKSYVHIVSKGHITKVICILCNIDFKTTKKAMAHVEDKHILDKIECGYCNMKFVYELKLRSHMAKRHKIKFKVIYSE